MRTNSSSKTCEAAFNLTELIVIVACLALLAMLVLPALANSANQSARAGCLANLRRLQTAAEMYRVENSDTLIPNTPFSGWIGGSSEGWGSNDWNTNTALYASTLIGRYLNNQLSALHCPGDVVPSANGLRIRSYSMNGQMGYTGLPTYNSGYRTYSKGSDLVCPTPASAFVFLDESPLSLNDGWFQLNLNAPGYSDIPAAYLDGGCGFSFADGHGEIHKWQKSFVAVPVRYGVTLSSLSSSGLDTDWLWLRQHAACHQ